MNSHFHSHIWYYIPDMIGIFLHLVLNHTVTGTTLLIIDNLWTILPRNSTSRIIQSGILVLFILWLFNTKEEDCYTGIIILQANYWKLFIQSIIVMKCSLLKGFCLILALPKSSKILSSMNISCFTISNIHGTSRNFSTFQEITGSISTINENSSNLQQKHYVASFFLPFSPFS